MIYSLEFEYGKEFGFRFYSEDFQNKLFWKIAAVSSLVDGKQFFGVYSARNRNKCILKLVFKMYFVIMFSLKDRGVGWGGFESVYVLQ